MSGLHDGKTAMATVGGKTSTPIPETERSAKACSETMARTITQVLDRSHIWPRMPHLSYRVPRLSGEGKPSRSQRTAASVRQLQEHRASLEELQRSERRRVQSQSHEADSGRQGWFAELPRHGAPHRRHHRSLGRCDASTFTYSRISHVCHAGQLRRRSRDGLILCISIPSHVVDLPDWFLNC